MSQMIEVEIKGAAPLLMHRFPEPTTEEKSRKRSGALAWQDEFEASKYVLPDGTLYQPSTHIEGALLKAGANFQIAGRRKKTYKDLIKGALIVLPEAIPHRIQQCDIDARAIVNPSTRGRVMRYRARLNRWELTFTVQLLDEQLPAEVVREILEHAGRYVGIGDYRPKFGRFAVTAFREVAP